MKLDKFEITHRIEKLYYIMEDERKYIVSKNVYEEYDKIITVDNTVWYKKDILSFIKKFNYELKDNKC